MENKVYDLKKRTYIYSLDIIKFLEGLPRDYISEIIGKQLLRSATPIGANIIEAQAASSKKDFANFYSHSLKSANESKFWLGLLKDSGKMSSDKVIPILNETNEISNILAASILTMKGKNKVSIKPFSVIWTMSQFIKTCHPEPHKEGRRIPSYYNEILRPSLWGSE